MVVETIALGRGAAAMKVYITTAEQVLCNQKALVVLYIDPFNC